MNVTVLADWAWWVLAGVTLSMIVGYIALEIQSLRDVEDDPMGDLP